MSDQIQLNSLPLTKSGVTAVESMLPYRDYSNDPYWLDLYAKIKELRALLKAHEKEIDMAEETGNYKPFTNPLTGEHYNLQPPLTTYVPTVTVSIPNETRTTNTSQ